MKPTLTLLFCVIALCARGQRIDTIYVQDKTIMKKVLLVSESKYSKCYVEINKNSGYVININSRYDKAGRYYFATFLDTLTERVENNESVFRGTKTKLQFINNKPVIIIQEKPDNEQKKFELDTVPDNNTAYIDINNGIWWNFFIEMSHQINENFPLQHYSFRNGFVYWRSFVNKNDYYQGFQIFAKKRTSEIKDSITSVNIPLVDLTNELLKNIDSIEYADLKKGLLKLPMEYKSKSWYFGTVLNALCNSRPELFYKLVEEMPEKKDMLFLMTDTDKNTVNKLKKANTDSPMKKEFIKYKRRETNFKVYAITLYTVGMIAFWGGIIYLIVK